MELALFRGMVKFVLTTRAEGNFQPISNGFTQRMEKALQGAGANDGFSIRTNFTNTVIKDVSLDFSPQNITFWRSNCLADAVITERRKRALIIHNADCPVGILFDAFRNRLCLAHLGLNNLYRKSGDISTLEAAVRALKTDPQKILFWFGGGIQKCCYGYEKGELTEDLKKKFGENVVESVVEKGPALGKEAIDLHRIIFKEALRLKLDLKPTIETTRCASCWGVEKVTDCQMGHYWSNVRDQKSDGQKFRPRNAALAIMV